MIQLRESAVRQTVTFVKTLALCAVAGGEAGYVIAGVEGAKYGALTGMIVGAGLLIYFATQDHPDAELAYPDYSL